MTDNADTLTLKPRQHGKLGIIHCGVTREGLVTVAGEQLAIEDGQEVTATRAAVKVTRKGDDYIFTRTAAQAA